MTQALIAFGANLGDAQASLKEAASRVADHPEIEVMAVANPMVTAAVSGEEDDNNDSTDPAPDYLNSAIRIETSLTAEALFQVTRGLENDMGRQRRQRWGPRTIDLDIILFGHQIIDDPQLQVPHRRMSFRKFVIGPASEIAGELIDPISGVSLKDLADRLQHSPETILWIAGHKGAAEAGAAEAGATGVEAAEAIVESFHRSGWGFKIATNIEGVDAPFKDFRLMLFSASEESFGEAALRFAGPWLDLTGLGEMQCQREIRAAIQAMA